MSMTGKQMRELRERRGMSQDEFGAALGISRDTVINYEKGSRAGRPLPIPKLVSLACDAFANGSTGYSEKEDPLQLEIFPLWTLGGPRDDVVEWCLENLKGATVFNYGIVKFSDTTDAVMFKLTWSGELEKRSK